MLAAPRTAVDRTWLFGPAGGLPRLIRVDRSKDFLCTTVASALAAFEAGVECLIVDHGRVVENASRSAIISDRATLPP
ncbi:hypothetical protein [Streptomyces sp. WMMB303]|uniref:hypothetical protein n=1 Tax=Streptomyces sp. WMMB303 TaxID=3034154 RepID=UPI0023EDC43A|nr:hypothetical protein [Streptomyces sp. WMMB303]MDF4251178.1 hypothetical protein [Streptomyces sp. WMMB303]